MIDKLTAGTQFSESGNKKTEKIEDAARQFESLLIAQMLKSMRESGSGWLGTGDDAAAESAVSMAEEQFAQALAASGGLGLAKMVSKGLSAAPQKE